MIVRLVKLLFFSVLLVAFIWLGANIKLGKRTLFEHLQAIGTSSEANDLVEGAKSRARPAVEGTQGMVKEARKAAAERATKAAKEGPPLEDVTAEDRKELKDKVRDLAGRPGRPSK